MSNSDAKNEHYSSDLIDNLLSKITPEQQQRTALKMRLAAKIYAGLKARGWKSLDLARALNVKSPSLVSKWLSGTHNFTADTLIDIQRVLNIQLLDVESLPTAPGPNLNLTVVVEPVSLSEDIQTPLKRVVDNTGEVWPKRVSVAH